MTEELTAINLLEDLINFLKEWEDELRIIRQDNENELRNIKLRRELQNRKLEPALGPLTELEEGSKVFQSADEPSNAPEVKKIG